MSQHRFAVAAEQFSVSFLRQIVLNFNAIEFN